MISEEYLQFIKQRHDACLNQYDGNKDNMTFPFMVKVSEEIGELADEVLKAKGMARESKILNFKKEDLEGEVVDALNTILMLAHNLDVDINESITKKITYINERQFK